MPFFSKQNIKNWCKLPKVLDITYPTPQQQTITTTALPTTEPATSQIIYTVQSSDLPGFSGDLPLYKKFTAILLGAGKNNDVSTSRTLYYRVIKNGASITNGSVTAVNNQFWTLETYNLYDVQAGDVIELRLWGSSSSLDLSWQGMFIIPTNVAIGKEGCPVFNLYMDVNLRQFSTGGFSSSYVHPLVVTSVSPSLSAYRTTPLYGIDGADPNAHKIAICFTEPLGTNGGGTLRCNRGDTTRSVNLWNSSSVIPMYARYYTPSKVSYSSSDIKLI